MSWRLDIFCFPNGLTAVCDENGKQIAELQDTEKESIKKIIKYLKNKLDALSGKQEEVKE